MAENLRFCTTTQKLNLFPSINSWNAIDCLSGIDTLNMQSKIYSILKKISPESDFNESSHFIDDGLLDSFSMVEFMVALELEYGIKIKGIDVLQDNFNSMENIIHLLKR
jgi:acyl carrier protein